MNVVEATWLHAVKICWSLIWRVFLIALPLMFLAGYFLIPFGVSDQVQLMVVNLLTLPITIIAIRWLVGTKYSDVTLVLAANEENET